MVELKILTLNTWGIPYVSKDLEFRMNALGDALAKSDYDIVGLQEVWSEYYYKLICEKVKDVLPYSHHFVSGFLGTGCVTLSKYPIVDTMFHKFLFNGYFWDFFHGDWYGGKGITGCIIKHPEKLIHFFNTHAHADYRFQDPALGFVECRTLQVYQSIQFIKNCTRNNDAIIMTGDFNHKSHEIGIIGMTELISLRDTYEISKDKPDECYTVDTKFNHRYNDPNEEPARIDYIFVNDYFECLSCNLAMQMIPETSFHFSDHEGYEVNLKFDHDKHTVDHAAMETQEGQNMLKQMLDIVKDGESQSKTTSLNKTVALFALFLVCIVAPSVGVVDINTTQSWLGKLFFVFQAVLTIVCTVYLWMTVVLRKQEENAFKNVASEIQNKLNFFEELKSAY